MKLKGHYKIELRDAKTGRLTDERVGHNFVTEFTDEIFKEIGYLLPDPWVNRSINNLVDDLFGGIMCFDSAINESTDMAGKHPHPLFPPKSKRMVANGSILWNTSSAIVTEIGSYNAGESVASNGRMRRFVYDWDTNEGNGTIGCVCLSSSYGGYIGVGNFTSNNSINSGQQQPNTFDCAKDPIQKPVNSYTNPMATINGSNYGNKVVYIHLSRNVIGVLTDFQPASGSLTITEYDIASSKLNIFASNANVLAGNKRVVNTRTYTFNPITDSTATIHTGCHYGYFYILTASNPANTGNVTNILKFNIDNTQEQYRFTHRIRTSNSTDFQLVFLDNYIMLFNSEQEYCYFLAYNIQTGTFEEKDRADFDPYNARTYRSFDHSDLLEDVWYVGKLGIRVINNVITYTPINAHWLVTPYLSVVSKSWANGSAIDDPYYSWVQDNNGLVYSLGTLKRSYLATIANLSSPVTKTADKTMKITYTLTLQED